MYYSNVLAHTIHSRSKPINGSSRYRGALHRPEAHMNRIASPQSRTAFVAEATEPNSDKNPTQGKEPGEAPSQEGRSQKRECTRPQPRRLAPW